MNSIAFIGAGKVGIALGRYFRHKGMHITGYYSKTEASSIRCAEATGSQSYKTLDGLAQSLPDAVFITTPDDAVSEVSEALCLTRFDGLVCHTSGALSSDALCPRLTRRASMHPPYSFANYTDCFDLDDLTFAVEGDMALVQILKERKINYFIINKEQKTKYHLAASILSNFMVTLTFVGQDILKDTGIDLHIFDKLMQNTLDNIIAKGTSEALTGPIKRGDSGTVQKHLTAIDARYKAFYKLLAITTLEIAGLSEDRQKKIKEVIQNG